MERTICYIDRRLCTGARFSFCDDCKKAQLENADEILHPKTPLELTAKHIPSKDKKGNQQ